MLPELTLALSLDCCVLVILGLGKGAISSPLIGTHNPGLCDMRENPLRFALPASMACPLCCWTPERDSPLHSDALSNNYQVLAMCHGPGVVFWAAIHPEFKLTSSP